MKKNAVLSLFVTPLLLIIVGVLIYLAISNSWNFELSSLGIFLFTLIYIRIFEWKLPLKPNWKAKKVEIWNDLKHLFLSAMIFDAVGKSLAIAMILYIQAEFFNVLEFWDSVPFLISFVVANIVGEFLPYLYHRVSHVGKRDSSFSIFLWKIHAIHHIPVTLNWFKANWVHPVNMFLNTFLKVAPLLALGFNEEVLFAVGATHVVIAYLSHANIRSQTGWLDYVLVTPKVHQFHHSTKLEEAKNFGNILPFWDLIFGTYFNKKETVEDVGVSQDGFFTYPETGKYLEQVIYPFKSKKKEKKLTTAKSKKENHKVRKEIA